MARAVCTAASTLAGKVAGGRCPWLGFSSHLDHRDAVWYLDCTRRIIAVATLSYPQSPRERGHVQARRRRQASAAREREICSEKASMSCFMWLQVSPQVGFDQGQPLQLGAYKMQDEVASAIAAHFGCCSFLLSVCRKAAHVPTNAWRGSSRWGQAAFSVITVEFAAAAR
jgi:hypothetical protein